MATGKIISANPLDDTSNYSNIFGVDGNNGLGNQAVVSNNASSSTIKGVSASTPFGADQADYAKGKHPKTSDRVTSVPSGWNLDFSVDVGQGLSSNTRSFGADNETSSPVGEFTYFKPLGNVQGDYNSLPN